MIKRSTTLAELEERAKEQEDGSWSKKIRGEWLEVIWVESTVVKHFEYKWGKNFVPREVADKIMQSI